MMAQTWHNLLFAHWSLPPGALRLLIPKALELDTFDGKAWLGVVPFRMSGVRLRGTPSLPWISAFPELNVRTYVSLDGKPGVYFFSLDAGNSLAVAAARVWFHLPYFNANMNLSSRGDEVHYFSQRTHRRVPAAEFAGSYRPVSDVFAAEQGTLEHWLTERYCLYAVASRQRIYRGEIHHAPWPLQRAEADIQENTMALAHDIALPATGAVLHYAHKLEVVVWPLQRI
jgi:uncharacterized protein YqjF (DUF2071 family)